MELRCFRCKKTPSELSEYVAAVEGTDETPEEYVEREEGTLNLETGEFACTACYIAIGQPANPFPSPPWTP